MKTLISEKRILKLRNIIIQSRSRLIRDYPFFALMLMHTGFVAGLGMNMISTNGKCIFFNPDYLEKLRPEEVDFILCHQIVHIINEDIWRPLDLAGESYHHACDIVANSFLDKEGWHVDKYPHLGKVYKTNFVNVPGWLQKPMDVLQSLPYSVSSFDERTKRRFMMDSDEWWGSNPSFGMVCIQVIAPDGDSVPIDESDTKEKGENGKEQENGLPVPGESRKEDENGMPISGGVKYHPDLDGYYPEGNNSNGMDDTYRQSDNKSIDYSDSTGETEQDATEKAPVRQGYTSEWKTTKEPLQNEGKTSQEGIQAQELPINSQEEKRASSSKINGNKETDDDIAHETDKSKKGQNHERRKSTTLYKILTYAEKQELMGFGSPDEIKAQWKMHLATVMKTSEESGRSTGKLPLFAERALGEMKKPLVDWRHILDVFIQEEICDYSFSPPDRRFMETDFFLPDYNERDFSIKNILFMVDTSGSISNTALVEAYSEINGAIEQFGGKLQGLLGFFDAEVTPPLPFANIEDIRRIRPIGGGGTSFYSVFEYIEKHMQFNIPSAIIIMTDGYAEYPPQSMARGIPVLWLLNNREIMPPWGKIARRVPENSDM